MAEQAVDVVDVTKTYSGARVRALDGVSVAFAADTFTTVMGPSGSMRATPQPTGRPPSPAACRSTPLKRWPPCPA